MAMVAACTLCGVSANAQQAASTSAEAGEPLQTVTITGTLLKRTDTETPSPVQILSADDLKNSGYTNISDVLRNVSANGSGALNQSFGQAFAAGASGIALRGL
jgi:iron complex outermembrane recepter protein